MNEDFKNICVCVKELKVELCALAAPVLHGCAG